MFQRKTLIILGITAVVIIGLAIALLLANDNFFKPNPSANQNENVNQQTATTTLPTAVKPQPVSTLKSSNEQALATVARNFAERFASFSTDAGYLNLEEVKLLATSQLKVELDKMAAADKESPPKSYYGVSSRVLKLEVKEFNEAGNTAKITITLQRQESRANQPDLVRYQDLNLGLIKTGEQWLVDSFTWGS